MVNVNSDLSKEIKDLKSDMESMLERLNGINKISSEEARGIKTLMEYSRGFACELQEVLLSHR